MPAQWRLGAMVTALALTVCGVSLAAQSVQYRSPAGVEYRAQTDTGPIARAASALVPDPTVERIIQLGVAQSCATSTAPWRI